jgi:hypothetical protein
MVRNLEWLSALIGAIICMGGAASVVGSQPGPVWPLPALVLIDWAALGLIGFIAAAIDGDAHSDRWGTVIWAVLGALVALTVLGALSIGPFVLLSALAFAATGLLRYKRGNRKVSNGMRVFAVGMVANFALLLVVILVGATLR